MRHLLYQVIHSTFIGLWHTGEDIATEDCNGPVGLYVGSSQVTWQISLDLCSTIHIQTDSKCISFIIGLPIELNRQRSSCCGQCNSDNGSILAG